MKSRILGINDGHGASAAIMDKKVHHVAAGGTGFPFQSIPEVLRLAGLTIGDIDEVRLATVFQGSGPLFFDHLPLLRSRAPKVFAPLDKWFNPKRVAQVRSLGFDGKVRFVEHHPAHVASAYYSSPWRDNVLALSLDGAGDGFCATVNVGDDGALRCISKTTSENSLGYIYGIVAELIRMQPYQVMTSVPNSYAMLKSYISTGALAAYDVLNSYIGLDGLRFKKNFSGSIHGVRNLALRDLRDYRPLDIAVGLQRLTEELMVEWVSRAMEQTGLGRITAAGGVFLNTRANERIRVLPGVEGFFVPSNPGPGDESTSIGAAALLAPNL